MRTKKRRQRRQNRLNQATLEDIIRENPDLFRGGNVNLLPEAEVEGTYGEVNQRRRRRRDEFIESIPELGKEIGFEAARMAPILGDVIDVAEVGQVAKTGKDFYGEDASAEVTAAMAAAGFLVPNIIEKPLKKGFKALKKVFKKAPPPPIKSPIPDRTRVVQTLKNFDGDRPAPKSAMSAPENAYHTEINKLKHNIDTKEGKERVKNMVVDEIKFIEADPHTPKEIKDQIAPLLLDKELLDRKVQEVFYGGKQNKGFMNTTMRHSGPGDRATYSPVNNMISPSPQLESADHEMAHSIQHNIVESLGLDTKHYFGVRERPDLQAQGIRGYGSRGVALDRDILKGVQMTDDPNLIRPTHRPDYWLKAAKTYAEKGFDIDPKNIDFPREEIRLRNAARGHRTNEPYPMLAEERRRMMDELPEMFPNRHAPVTGEMIERFRNTRTGNLGLTIPTDFQSPDVRSFANRRMAELMNKMPALIPALAGAGYLRSQRGEQNKIKTR